MAIALYFLLKPYVGTETVSWMCILGAAPFAAMGFINYHGMTAEQFLWAWIRSELLEPREIRFQPINLYYEMMKENLEKVQSKGISCRQMLISSPRRYSISLRTAVLLISRAT